MEASFSPFVLLLQRANKSEHGHQALPHVSAFRMGASHFRYGIHEGLERARRRQIEVGEHPGGRVVGRFLTQARVFHERITQRFVLLR
jgi:hypothetical protein